MLHHPHFFAQCHLCSLFSQTHFSLCFPNSSLSPMTLPPFPSFSSSLFLAYFFSAPTSFSLFPAPFHSSSLCSLIIIRHCAVKPFNGSVGVLKVWLELLLSKCTAEYHSPLWSSFPLWNRSISEVHVGPVCPSYQFIKRAGELVPRFNSDGLSPMRQSWEEVRSTWGLGRAAHALVGWALFFCASISRSYTRIEEWN